MIYQMFDIRFVKNVHADNKNVGSLQALRFVTEAAHFKGFSI